MPVIDENNSTFKVLAPIFHPYPFSAKAGATRQVPWAEENLGLSLPMHATPPTSSFATKANKGASHCTSPKAVSLHSKRKTFWEPPKSYERRVPCLVSYGAQWSEGVSFVQGD